MIFLFFIINSVELDRNYESERTTHKWIFYNKYWISPKSVFLINLEQIHERLQMYDIVNHYFWIIFWIMYAQEPWNTLSHNYQMTRKQNKLALELNV